MDISCASNVPTRCIRTFLRFLGLGLPGGGRFCPIDSRENLTLNPLSWMAADSRHWHLSLGQDYARAKELPVVSCHLLRELRTSHSYSLGSALSSMFSQNTGSELIQLPELAERELLFA